MPKSSKTIYGRQRHRTRCPECRGTGWRKPLPGDLKQWRRSCPRCIGSGTITPRLIRCYTWER